MLVKTNEKTESGKDIYQNALTGSKGILGIVEQTPATRRQRRAEIYNSSTKIKSNRKYTRGRRLYFQTFVHIKEVLFPVLKRNMNGKYEEVMESLIKVKKTSIKHIQETADALRRKSALLEFYDKVYLNKQKNDNSKKQ